MRARSGRLTVLRVLPNSFVVLSLFAGAGIMAAGVPFAFDVRVRFFKLTRDD